MGNQQLTQKLVLVVALAVTLTLGTEASPTRDLKADPEYVYLGIIGSGVTERKVYYANSTEYTFKTAQYVCYSLGVGAGLLTVDSEEEILFLKIHVGGRPTKRTSNYMNWVAGKEIDSLDKFVWQREAGGELLPLKYKPPYLSATEPSCLGFDGSIWMTLIYTEVYCTESYPALCQQFV